VRHVLDENLNTVYSADYAAYGDVIASEGVNPMEYGFTGQPMDANGLAYHRARFYDPSLGVWLSEDPLELMNRYGYVSGNPSNFVDPSGYTESCGSYNPCTEPDSNPCTQFQDICDSWDNKSLCMYLTRRRPYVPSTQSDLERNTLLGELFDNFIHLSNFPLSPPGDQFRRSMNHYNG